MQHMIKIQYMQYEAVEGKLEHSVQKCEKHVWSNNK